MHGDSHSAVTTSNAVTEQHNSPIHSSIYGSCFLSFRDKICNDIRSTGEMQEFSQHTTPSVYSMSVIKLPGNRATTSGRMLIIVLSSSKAPTHSVFTFKISRDNRVIDILLRLSIIPMRWHCIKKLLTLAREQSLSLKQRRSSGTLDCTKGRCQLCIKWAAIAPAYWSHQSASECV